MNINKNLYRKHCLTVIRNLRLYNKIYRDNLVNQKIEYLFKKKHGLNILFYWPLEIEANIQKSLIKIRKRNNIFLPFMQDVSFKIVPFRLPLSHKKFNIYEANNSNRIIKNIDVAIIPAVGIDIKARRIGFGKGMYDRFFANTKNNPYKIFIQSQVCYIKKDICDEFDISCDIFISPSVTLLHKRKKNVNSNINRNFNSNYRRGDRFFHF